MTYTEKVAIITGGNMKTTRWFLLAACFFIMAAPAWGQSPAARQRLSMNSGWRFEKGDPPGSEGLLSYVKIKHWVNAGGSEFVSDASARKVEPKGNPVERVSYAQRDFDDRGWRQVNLPHDWGIEGPFKQEYPGETGKLPWWGVGWYRKHFPVSTAEKGKQIYLDIDGAMAYATVWLNGHFVGGWPYGYASFELDLTPYIAFGSDNVIAIRLDNPPDSSRWYPGGGIYRNVWLVRTAPVHVRHWGTFVTTNDVSRSAATVNLKVSLDNDSASSANVLVKTQVYELSNGQKTSKPISSSAPIAMTIAAGASDTSTTTMRVNNPRLWKSLPPQTIRKQVITAFRRQLMFSGITTSPLSTGSFVSPIPPSHSLRAKPRPR